jgi:GDP-D-mannose dehydratase
VTKTLEEAHDNMDEALKIYLEIKTDPNKVETMLLMLKEDPRMYATARERADRVKVFAEKHADKVVAAYKVDHMEDRAWVRKMVFTDIVKSVNDHYYVTANMELLGASEDEALMTLKSEKRKEFYDLLKGKTQEAMKKAAKTTRRIIAKP